MDAKQMIVTFVLLFITVAFCQQENHERHRVNVSVYYESLCPDSIKFFTQQLYPSLQGNISNYVNLTLLPYGKSKTSNEFGQIEFECHHGPGECQGNRLQACAINLIDGGHKTQGLGYNKITTGFINCLMDKVNPDGEKTVFPTQDCATINHVPNYKEIENCANHPDGSKYLQQIGDATNNLNPKLTSVPTIVFNNQYKADDSTLAQKNFVKALCQYIHGEKPAECSRSSAATSQLNYAIVLALSAVLFYY